MTETITGPSSALTLGAIAGSVLVLLVAAVVAVLSVLIGQSGCLGSQAEAVPITQVERGIPGYLALYREAAREYAVPWQVLAGIGSIETDHGRSSAPGVRSGVNSAAAAPGRCSSTLATGRLTHPSPWLRHLKRGLPALGSASRAARDDLNRPRCSIAGSREPGRKANELRQGTLNRPRKPPRCVASSSSSRS